MKTETERDRFFRAADAVGAAVAEGPDLWRACGAAVDEGLDGFSVGEIEEAARFLIRLGVYCPPRWADAGRPPSGGPKPEP